jgi:hypothetical protein
MATRRPPSFSSRKLAPMPMVVKKAIIKTSRSTRSNFKLTTRSRSASDTTAYTRPPSTEAGMLRRASTGNSRLMPAPTSSPAHATPRT